jgi:hypothetical protein
MLGGHWWDDWDTYPDEDEGAHMALNILRRHLNITDMPVSIGLERLYPAVHGRAREKDGGCEPRLAKI